MWGKGERGEVRKNECVGYNSRDVDNSYVSVRQTLWVSGHMVNGFNQLTVDQKWAVGQFFVALRSQSGVWCVLL